MTNIDTNRYFLLKLFVLVLTCFALFIPVQTASAQDRGSLEGVITDANDDETLIGATVVLQGTNRGAATNTNGRYQISQIEPGTYTLTASYLGYEQVNREVEIISGESITVNFSLQPASYQGEEVVISAQAQGQIEAINRQRNIDKIANVVSESRIQELPDVNAAESIGRLPGISIQRSGGEANKVAIRGLSPKYNNITVNGVRVPSTGANDRSVDLSTISSSMLDGIVVTKANTADQPADALGGTVDLELKKAPSDFQIEGTAQGGYNALVEEAENYKFNLNGSNRFFNDKLGIIGGFNIDRNNRSSDQFSGNFREATNTASETIIIFNNVGFRDEQLIRDRVGANLTADYRLKNGNISASAFFNRRNDEGIFRQNLMNITDASLSYELFQRDGETDIFTGMLDIEQDFGWVNMDLTFARTSSSTENPNDYNWVFTQDGQVNLTATPQTTVEDLLSDVTRLPNLSGFRSTSVQTTDRDEDNTSLGLDLTIPLELSNSINGFIKTGTKLRWLDRFNDENATGRGGLVYGNVNGPNTALECIAENMPNLGVEEATTEFGVLPITTFNNTFDDRGFLNNQFPTAFPVGFGPNIAGLRQVTETFRNQCSDEWLNQSIASLGRDYDGTERYQAGYVMANIDIGDYITFIPGIRFESDFSRYSAFRFRQVTQNNTEQPPEDLEELTVERNNNFWLPMIHVIGRPTEWMDIRFAYTETITRPDFIQFAPITTINSFQTFVQAANSQLVPADAKNFDLSLSLFKNRIGFFSVSLFRKGIDNLIFQTEFDFRQGVEPLPGMNIPEAWLDANPDAQTFVNNPFKATLKGIEFDWQTSFWFLPDPFKGITLNVNYTVMDSDMKVRQFKLEQETVQIRPFPIIETTVIDTFRTTRLPDQPDDVLNLSVGYDYKGFSARASFLYQTESLTFIDREPALDNFVGDLKRWDISLRQVVNNNFEIFANINNVTNRPDRNFRGENLTSPTFSSFFGLTADLGVKLSL
mgnify:CR=1 FL=1